MENKIDNFTPRILAFLCSWCSYAGADMAGVSRIQYPANIRVIRVMCSGRVDPVFVIQGFLNKADGIMILGCHPGDCHYLQGNYEAMNTFNAIKTLVDYAGVSVKRILLNWVSASEGTRFRDLVESFTRQIKGLGQLGVLEGKTPEELDFELEAARAVAKSEKFRWVMSKQTEFMRSGNKYGERFTRHEMDRALESVTVDALKEAKILLTLARAPASVKEVAEALKLPPFEVLRFITVLRKRKLAALHSVKGNSPLYFLANEGSGIKNGKIITDSRRQSSRHPISAGRI